MARFRHAVSGVTVEVGDDDNVTLDSVWTLVEEKKPAPARRAAAKKSDDE